MASFALTNRDLRDMYLESIPTPEEYKSAPYPENIKLSNLLYFWWAPTLIYQPVYPRTDRFRWSFFLKRSGEAIGILIALWFIIAQYATYTPTSPFSAIPLISSSCLIQSLSEYYLSLFCYLLQTNPQQLHNSNQRIPPRQNNRTRPQTLDCQSNSLACRLLLHLPFHTQRPGGNNALRRPQILRRMVEFRVHGRLLAIMEYPCSLLFQETYLRSS